MGNRLHKKYFKVTNSEQINKLTGFKIYLSVIHVFLLKYKKIIKSFTP